MQRSKALLAVCFCAGLLGALASSTALWLCGKWGLTALAGVALPSDFTQAWLFPRLIWGGLWGLVYFIAVKNPRIHRQWARKGMWISLLPTAAQLFYVFPYQTSYGLMGIGLGMPTPIFILLLNLIWGFFTGLFACLLWGRG